MGGRGRASVLLWLSCLLIPSYFATDTLDQTKQLSYGELLESSNDLFRLGFFLPNGDRRTFLGIWYNDETWYRGGGEFVFVDYPVWIANPNSPIFTNSGILSVNGNGSLEILSDQRKVIPIYSSTRASIQASATLQNDGNFVLHELNSDGSVKSVLWQSFDHPTDTLLPGMKLGINFNSGLNWTLTSWDNDGGYNSPASGPFTLGLNPNGTNELIMWRQGDLYWRSGPWQRSYSGFPQASYYGYNFSFTQNENEMFFYYTSTIIFSRIRIHSADLQSDGLLMIYAHGFWSPLVSCDHDGWLCLKQKLPKCRNIGDTLLDEYNYINKKLGSMSKAGYRFSESHNMTIEDCKAKCLLNCSCFAYASTNIVNQSGCEIWTSRTIFGATQDGRYIYFLPSKGSKWWKWPTIAVGGIMIIPSFVSICYIIWKNFTSNGDENINQRTLIKELEGDEAPSISSGKPKSHKKDTNEIHVFSFESIVYATNYFSTANKLGEGGFGPVYKGILFDGREVAIKRLSRSSGQGMAEFKNEALLIAKLQHTNLVRLLGFCIQGEEKILIYEYMPNKSLDSFLFDAAKKKMLNWNRRLIIVEGVAQGLLYLHKYSRLRVVHRDLKASNILLDADMNPKISDFGLARIFDVNEYEANTNRVVWNIWLYVSGICLSWSRFNQN
ncbi:hypothetical protein SLEP1_g50682 [Rubroshorea leprosula]|uniref:Receptor-like serine/threonine-protein kinase n=1 Tax=Rubroshorea leprosula TaxID=152421 RepID=A0AAV5M0T2_9ROSI|nr:hypothetical protein SLEP1_g50682 [Rubroshorea leprosula]